MGGEIDWTRAVQGNLVCAFEQTSRHGSQLGDFDVRARGGVGLGRSIGCLINEMGVVVLGRGAGRGGWKEWGCGMAYSSWLTDAGWVRRAGW